MLLALSVAEILESKSVEFCERPLKEGVAVMDDRSVTWINRVSASFDICHVLLKIYSLRGNHFNTEVLRVFLCFLSRKYFIRPIHILITSSSGTLLNGSAGRCVGGGLHASARNPLA